MCASLTFITKLETARSAAPYHLIASISPLLLRVHACLLLSRLLIEKDVSHIRLTGNKRGNNLNTESRTRAAHLQTGCRVDCICCIYQSRFGAMAESNSNGTKAWSLPEKWSEDLVDEKGEKMSKRYVSGFWCFGDPFCSLNSNDAVLIKKIFEFVA